MLKTYRYRFYIQGGAIITPKLYFRSANAAKQFYHAVRGLYNVIKVEQE